MVLQVGRAREYGNSWGGRDGITRDNIYIYSSIAQDFFGITVNNYDNEFMNTDFVGGKTRKCGGMWYFAKHMLGYNH